VVPGTEIVEQNQYRHRNPGYLGEEIFLPDNPKIFRLFGYKKNRTWSEGPAFVIQIGLTTAGSIFFCFFVGLHLDRWLGTKGIFLFLFILFGVVGCAYTAYRQIQETIEKDQKREQQAGEEDHGRA